MDDTVKGQGTSRRRFLAVSAAAGAAVGLVHCGGGASQPVGNFDVGAVSQFAVGACVVDTTNHLVIQRDDQGLYAMSSLCTHQQCDVTCTQGGAAPLDCFCHGSLFDKNGGVVRGPASAPLPHYAVTVQNGRVLVNTGSTVAASDRTPVGT